MPAAPSPFRPARRLIGYARVSTEEQATDAQLDELRAAGCAIVHEEHGSGASRARPVLAEAHARDRRRRRPRRRAPRPPRPLGQPFARRSSRTLEERGAHFRSLRDPIDTSTPQGMFSLQVLGAVAQLERALISERTKAGIKAAKARGKLARQSGAARAQRADAIRTIAAARRPRLSRRPHRLRSDLAAHRAADAAAAQLGRRRPRAQPQGPALDRRAAAPLGAPARARAPGGAGVDHDGRRVGRRRIG